MKYVQIEHIDQEVIFNKYLNEYNRIMLIITSGSSSFYEYNSTIDALADNLEVHLSEYAEKNHIDPNDFIKILFIDMDVVPALKERFNIEITPHTRIYQATYLAKEFSDQPSSDQLYDLLIKVWGLAEKSDDN